MAVEDEQSPTSPLEAPLKTVTRVLSDGVYGATYIPDDSDELGAAVTEAVRRGPFYLAFRDLWTCLSMFTLFPGVVTPLWTSNPQDEFYIWNRNFFGLLLLTIASIFEVVLLALCVPMFLLLPGPISIVMFVLGQILIHVICFPMQGPSRVWSKRPTNPEEIAKHERNTKERWFFLNGCCVSGHNLQQNVDLLSETFGRPIFAIHNRTYGVLGDLFECILQRSFDLFTEETRVCYEYVKAYTTDPNVTKAVLIAHSQGCIMASQILDQLYVDLPAEAVSKLEVYTFGNAASHFNNPLRKLSNSPTTIDQRDVKDGNVKVTTDDGHNVSSTPTLSHKDQAMQKMLPERVIPYIEHYCNSQDMVTRWGALFSAKSILSNRFCGHIFINEGASGHMMNQHYLSDMFPIHNRRAGAGHVKGTSSEDKHHGVPFLDRVVHLDTATVTQRGSNAIHQLAVMRHESAPRENANYDHADGHDIHKVHSRKERERLHLKLGEGTELTNNDLSGAEGSRISVVRRHGVQHEDVGKTVRELSRLWKYMDGKDPDLDY